MTYGYSDHNHNQKPPKLGFFQRILQWFFKTIFRALILIFTINAVFGILFVWIYEHCGKKINWTEVWYKINYPHEIILVDDILVHWFPLLTTFMYMFGTIFIFWFFWYIRALKRGDIIKRNNGTVIA